jgi:hypothetical protein
MNTPATDTRVYDQYLAEANAELDAMLETGTPEPEAVPPAPDRSWAKLLLVGLIAVVLFCLGVALLRGRRPTRMMVNALR